MCKKYFKSIDPASIQLERAFTKPKVLKEIKNKIIGEILWAKNKIGEVKLTITWANDKTCAKKEDCVKEAIKLFEGGK